MDFGRNITRVKMREVRNAYQLEAIDCQKVISAGFADDEQKHFEINFETEAGKKVDLLIMFERRHPEIFISEPYR